MNIGERIKRRRKEIGMSMETLGTIIGVNKSTIHRYEKGEIENFSVSALMPIAKALRCSPGYLMGWEENLDFTLDNDLILETRKVPLLGDISCGKPITANEVHEEMATLINDVTADFALRCKGDSMINARICDGDIVFIKNGTDYSNGDIVAVIIDDEATLKRIYVDQANEMLTLVPENPMFPVIRLQGEEMEHVRVIGKAVAFQSCIR